MIDGGLTQIDAESVEVHAEDETTAAAVLSKGVDEPALAVDALDDGGVMSGVKPADPDVPKLDDVPGCTSE